MSVSIPDELKSKMNELEDINWSAVARKAFEERIKQIDLFKKIVSKSKLTEEDALEIGKKINAGMAKKFKELVARHESNN